MEAEQAIFEKFAAILQKEGQLDLVSPTMVNIFHNLSMSERRLIMKNGSIKVFLSKSSLFDIHGNLVQLRESITGSTNSASVSISNSPIASIGATKSNDIASNESSGVSQLYASVTTGDLHQLHYINAPSVMPSVASSYNKIINIAQDGSVYKFADGLPYSKVKDTPYQVQHRVDEGMDSRPPKSYDDPDELVMDDDDDVDNSDRTKEQQRVVFPLKPNSVIAGAVNGTAINGRSISGSVGRPQNEMSTQCCVSCTTGITSSSTWCEECSLGLLKRQATQGAQVNSLKEQLHLSEIKAALFLCLFSLTDRVQQLAVLKTTQAYFYSWHLAQNGLGTIQQIPSVLQNYMLVAKDINMLFSYCEQILNSSRMMLGGIQSVPSLSHFMMPSSSSMSTSQNDANHNEDIQQILKSFLQQTHTQMSSIQPTIGFQSTGLFPSSADKLYPYIPGLVPTIPAPASALPNAALYPGQMPLANLISPQYGLPTGNVATLAGASSLGNATHAAPPGLDLFNALNIGKTEAVSLKSQDQKSVSPIIALASVAEVTSSDTVQMTPNSSAGLVPSLASSSSTTIHEEAVNTSHVSQTTKAVSSSSSLSVASRLLNINKLRDYQASLENSNVNTQAITSAVRSVPSSTVMPSFTSYPSSASIVPQGSIPKWDLKSLMSDSNPTKASEPNFVVYDNDDSRMSTNSKSGKSGLQVSVGGNSESWDSEVPLFLSAKEKEWKLQNTGNLPTLSLSVQNNKASINTSELPNAISHQLSPSFADATKTALFGEKKFVSKGIKEENDKNKVSIDKSEFKFKALQPPKPSSIKMFHMEEDILSHNSSQPTSAPVEWPTVRQNVDTVEHVFSSQSHAPVSSLAALKLQSAVSETMALDEFDIDDSQGKKKKKKEAKSKENQDSERVKTMADLLLGNASENKEDDSWHQVAKKKSGNKEAEDHGISEKLINILQQQYPGKTRNEYSHVLNEIKKKYGGFLNGISIEQLKSEARLFLDSKAVTISGGVSQVTKMNAISGTENEKDPSKSRLFKTSMCTFHLAGRCSKGDKCPYAHNKSELRLPPKDQLCANIVKTGKCPHGDQCGFAHSQEEILKFKQQHQLAQPSKQPKQVLASSSSSVSKNVGGSNNWPNQKNYNYGDAENDDDSDRVPANYKTELCRYFAAGHCSNGASCQFAHGEAELQKKDVLCQTYILGKCKRGEKCMFSHALSEFYINNRNQDKGSFASAGHSDLMHNQYTEREMKLNEEDNEPCAICCDPMDNESSHKLSCGHIFHAQCIRSWLNNHQRTCPTCRSHALLPDEFPPLGMH